MSPQELEKEIRGWIERFVSQYPQGAERIWRTPLVGFADANSPYLQRLPELVMPGHRLPQDYLEQATVVISYFVPFTKAHGDQNLKGEKRSGFALLGAVLSGDQPDARSAEPRAGRGDPPAGISRGGALWHRDGRNAFQAR